MTIESQSGWRPNEVMKMSHPVSLGQLRIIISPFWTCITAKKSQKTILQQNMAWGVVKFGQRTWSIYSYNKEAIPMFKNVGRQFLSGVN